MNLQMQISSDIAAVYEFHDYEMAKEKIVEITKLIIRVRPSVTAEEIKDFCIHVKSGVYGTLYKAPSCLMSMFQEFNKEHSLPVINAAAYKPLRRFV